MMKHPSILHIDIDAFFAAAEVLVNPSLKGKPVIVGGNAEDRGVVSTASYEARKFGVHSGMSLWQAKKKCPNGIFIRGRFTLYSRISAEFFRCLREFSPDIDEVSVDEAYIGLKGMSFLYPSPYHMALEIKREVEKRTELKVSVGVGFTRLGAKLATEFAKPGGIFFLKNEKEYVNHMLIDKIPGIGHHTRLILNGMGIFRVKELEQKYPRIWKRAVGIPLNFSPRHYPGARESAAKSYSRETTFPHDIAEHRMLKSHLSYLTGRLSVYLKGKGLYAGRIEVKVRFSDFSTFTKRRSLQFPTYAFRDMWAIAADLFDELITKRDKAVRLVGVKVEDMTRMRGLLPFVSLKSEAETASIFRIKQKYGASAISTGQEMLLEKLYKKEKEGMVLKTASLTK